MKVDGVGGPKGPDGAKKAKKTGGANFADALDQAASPEPTAAPPAPTGVAAVEAVLAVQAAGTATDGRSKGLLMSRAEGLLDNLDAIQVGLLEGGVRKDKIVEMAQKLRERRQDSDDPKLNELLDEIELRAEVEIAKLTR